MSLTTLNSVKLACGIPTSDTTEDAFLTKLIRNCSSAIRRYTNQFMGGVITSISAANPTVITAPGHGLGTGDKLKFLGTNSTPSLDGTQYTITRLDDDTFSIPVTVSGAGTAGYYSREFIEYYSGDGGQLLRLKQRPVISVSSVYLDQSGYYGSAPGAFAASTLLTSGVDYALVLDDASNAEQSKTGIVARVNGVWTRPLGRAPGFLTVSSGLAFGNIKVTYQAGWMPIESDFQLACDLFVQQLRSMGDRGRALQSETFEDYSYSLASPSGYSRSAAGTAPDLGSVRQLLSGAKIWIW